MKIRFLAILPILLFLLNACVKIGEPAVDRSPSSGDPIGGGVSSSSDYISEKDSDDDGGRYVPRGGLFLYENRSFFQCGYKESDVYEFSLESGEAECILDGGGLIGLCDSILLAHDDNRCLMLDLEKGGEWIPLQDWQVGQYGTVAFNEDTIYYFAHIFDGRSIVDTFVDVIDRESGATQRKNMDIEIRSALLDGDTLYYLSGDRFYQADITNSQETLIGYVSRNSVLYQGKECVLIHDPETEIQLYHKQTGTISVQDFSESKKHRILMRGSVAAVFDHTSWSWRWFYDLDTGRELKSEEFWGSNEIMSGLWLYYDVIPLSGDELVLNSRIPKAEIEKYGQLGKIESNDRWSVLLTENFILSVDGENGAIRVYRHGTESGSSEQRGDGAAS